MSLRDDTLLEPSRRVFLKQAATVASGLAIALYLPSGSAASDSKTPALARKPRWPRAWPKSWM